MKERLLYEGRRGELQREAARIKLKLEGLREAIVTGLAKVRPLEEMKADIIKEQAFDFDEAQTEYKAVLAELAEIREILGR